MTPRLVFPLVLLLGASLAGAVLRVPTPAAAFDFHGLPSCTYAGAANNHFYIWEVNAPGTIWYAPNDWHKATIAVAAEGGQMTVQIGFCAYSPNPGELIQHGQAMQLHIDGYGGSIPVGPACSGLGTCDNSGDNAVTNLPLTGFTGPSDQTHDMWVTWGSYSSDHIKLLVVSQPTIKMAEVTFAGTPVEEDLAGAASTPVNLLKAPRQNCYNEPQADWEDCPSPDGAPDLVWPVAVTQGKPLTLVGVHMYVHGLGQDEKVNAELSASVDVGHGPIETLTAVDDQAAFDESQADLFDNFKTQSGALPSAVGSYQATITWTFRVSFAVSGSGYASEASQVSVESPPVTTKHPLYLTYGDVDPLQSQHLYLSSLNLASLAAQGQTTPDGVANAIWQTFASQTLHGSDLDPRTGKVTTRSDLLGYRQPWTLNDFLRGTWMENQGCPKNVRDELSLLQTGTGCSEVWAAFLRGALEDEGLVQMPSANAPDPVVQVGNEDGFPYGPMQDGAHSYMLMKPWTFTHKGGVTFSKTFPYVDLLVPQGDGAAIYTGKGKDLGFTLPAKEKFEQEFSYPGSGEVRVQGGGFPPPGLFTTGKYAVVKYQGKYYDPVYGRGPFDSIQAWADASLDGYAALEKRWENEKKTHAKTKVFAAHKGVCSSPCK